jgi:hypothetical protein
MSNERLCVLCDGQEALFDFTPEPTPDQEVSRG